jgi:Ni/Co efflux regulator RcnB
MKRLALAAIAAATMAAPIVAAPVASAQDGYYRDRDRDGDRDWRDRRDRDDDRYDRRDRRGDRWDRGRHRGWDNRRHNGYYRGDRWYYGPPPSAWRDDVRYGYRAWRRGDRLPAYYRNYYRDVDYRYYRLRPPPRGYHYVYDRDRDQYLLVGIATGIILGVILANN